MRFVAALLLLAPVAARAQSDPSAGSGQAAALVDSVVAALRVGEQAEAGLGSMRFNTGAGADLFAPAAVVDSVRAALLRDVRPGLLRDALPFLRGPAYAHLLDRARAAAEDPGALVALTLGMMFGAAPPKKGTLADSALTARYVAAAGTTRLTMEIMDRAMHAVAESVPAARADLERRGQTADEAIAAEVAEMEAQMAPLTVAAARVQLAGVPVGEVEAAIAYYESPAGRYVARAQFEGTLAAVVPGVVRWASAMASSAPLSVPEEGAPPGTPLRKP